MVEVGKARAIDKEEALGMLRQATEEGLVHVCDTSTVSCTPSATAVPAAAGSSAPS
jgi:hypothetical protein